MVFLSGIICTVCLFARLLVFVFRFSLSNSFDERDRVLIKVLGIP